MLQSTPTNPQPEPIAEDERTQAPVAPAATLDPAWGAGRKLTEARRQLGLSLDEVADRIRVRREFLQALEDMNIKLLPGKAYALAFLRSYARALGLDEKVIVDQFQDESALTREDAHRQIRDPSSRPNRERPWMAAAVLAVIAAVLVGWRMVERDGVSEDPRESSTIVQGPTEAAPSTAAAQARPILEIRALSEAWLEARGPDGTVFLSRTLRAGDVYRPDPSPGWTLHARDGGAFELYVDGASAGLLGAPGAPVLGRGIDGVEPLTQAELASRS